VSRKTLPYSDGIIFISLLDWCTHATGTPNVADIPISNLPIFISAPDIRIGRLLFITVFSDVTKEVKILIHRK